MVLLLLVGWVKTYTDTANGNLFYVDINGLKYRPTRISARYTCLILAPVEVWCVVYAFVMVGIVCDRLVLVGIL